MPNVVKFTQRAHNRELFGVSVSETMAARGHVNGRGPRRRRGRDSAKRVVSDTDTPKSLYCVIS